MAEDRAAEQQTNTATAIFESSLQGLVGLVVTEENKALILDRLMARVRILPQLLEDEDGV